MKNKYLDVKEGDWLEIGELELIVVSIEGRGNVKLRMPNRTYKIRKSKFFKMGDIGIYNFGRRHCLRGHHRGGFLGKRVHLRIEMPDRCEYQHSRRRDYGQMYNL